MEDSELCLQAANELGKETPVRFKIHLVSQITWIPTNQNKMVNAGKTKANKRGAHGMFPGHNRVNFTRYMQVRPRKWVRSFCGILLRNF